MNNLTMYAVINSQGQYFKSHNINTIGVVGTWVNDINNARVYTRTGGARTVITYFANNYPNVSLPKLLKLTLSNVEVIDETDRIQKALDKKAKAKLIRDISREKRRIEEIDREIKEAEGYYTKVISKSVN